MKTFELQPALRERMLEFTEGEITIMLGDDAAYNLKASLSLSQMLARSASFERVVYINLPFSRRRFTEAKHDVFGKDEANMQVYHVSAGRLTDNLVGMERTFENPERTAVVINSWELSSSNYRFREELVFQLRKLQMQYGMTIFVFAMCKPEKTEARKLNRSGLGKLSIAADAVVSLAEEKQEQTNSDEIDEQQNEVPTAENIITLAPPEERISEEVTEEESGVGVNLTNRKINNLPNANRHLSRRERRKVERLATIGRV